MMAIYLTIGQYEVIEAANGYEAIEQALTHRPDLILMDIAMPVLDGIDSTRAMREHDELKDIPILCLSAFGDFYKERAQAAGCNDVLQKPIDFNRLDSLLQQHVP